MPHLIDKSGKILVTTNYKVMFTRLKNVDGMKWLFMKQVLVHKLKHPFSEHLMMVRNPYEKLISFYKDKFRLDPVERLSIPGKQPQDAQAIFLPYLGIDTSHPREQIQQILLNVSFDTMIKLLPKVFYKNDHLHPQHWITNISFGRIKFTGLRFHPTILKLEQKDDMNYLSKKLNIDTSIRTKTTSSIHHPITYSPEQIRIVNQIYQADFRLYSYAMRQTEEPR